MITHIQSTLIIVSDQDASLDFYVNKLGWEKRTDQMPMPNYRYLTVAPVGAVTELVLGPAEIHGQPAGFALSQNNIGLGQHHSGITFSVDDLDGLYQTLSAKGVIFSQPPAQLPWGDRAAWMADPDGNSFFLIEIAKQ